MRLFCGKLRQKKGTRKGVFRRWNVENICGCFAACRAEVLLLHTGLTLLDELLGHAGAAAAGADGKGLGLDQQLVHGHLDMVLPG